jgi:hypothetical protein
MVLEPLKEEMSKVVPLVRRSRGSTSPISSTIAEDFFQTSQALEAVIYVAPLVADTTHVEEGTEARISKTSPVISLIQETEASSISTLSFATLQTPTTPEEEATPFAPSSGQLEVQDLDVEAKVRQESAQNMETGISTKAEGSGGSQARPGVVAAGAHVVPPPPTTPRLLLRPGDLREGVPVAPSNVRLIDSVIGAILSIISRAFLHGDGTGCIPSKRFVEAFIHHQITIHLPLIFVNSLFLL